MCFLPTRLSEAEDEAVDVSEAPETTEILLSRREAKVPTFVNLILVAVVAVAGCQPTLLQGVEVLWQSSSTPTTKRSLLCSMVAEP
mmetsp:Transcript_5059/g.10708  ORF Transcript_5059/g.10708 Transcript_5059/m.10708 type:complete len:86 (-) Transcript_5059:659-916(-)